MSEFWRWPAPQSFRMWRWTTSWLTPMSFSTRSAPGFDYVCVDLFQGERVDRRMSGRPFLRQLERVVNRGGTVCFNLFLDKRTISTIARIGRVLRVTREIRCGKNVVVHTRVG